MIHSSGPAASRGTPTNAWGWGWDGWRAAKGRSAPEPGNWHGKWQRHRCCERHCVQPRGQGRRRAAEGVRVVRAWGAVRWGVAGVSWVGWGSQTLSSLGAGTRTAAAPAEPAIRGTAAAPCCQAWPQLAWRRPRPASMLRLPGRTTAAAAKSGSSTAGGAGVAAAAAVIIRASGVLPLACRSALCQWTAARHSPHTCSGPPLKPP